MNRAAAPLSLSEGQWSTLRVLAHSQTTPVRQQRRARALLLAADGVANEAIAQRIGVSPTSVRAWRADFAERGLARFGVVRPGRGRKPTVPAETIDAIVETTRNSRPAGETHWSCRSMARKFGVSPATVQRIWSAHGLKPHLVDTFNLSHDPAFPDKLVDVVGLYLDPPDNAVALCMDEKTQAQALDRTQPSLPIRQGRAGTRPHDYSRDGTTTLFAALNVLTRTVIGQCPPWHRHEEFLMFLRRISHEVPEPLRIHLILDNHATHKHPDVQAWLTRHPRFHLHLTPTSSSWLNLVERWFRELTDKALHPRDSFNSVPVLIGSIEDYLAARNDAPKPFVWTATAESILEKVRCGRVTIQAVNHP